MRVLSHSAAKITLSISKADELEVDYNANMDVETNSKMRMPGTHVKFGSTEDLYTQHRFKVGIRP